MMNNDNSITEKTRLYGYIAEKAHASRFSTLINTLLKSSRIDAMVIPMNIRPDDVVFTVSQMRRSKLSGAIIATEYQEEAYRLLDDASERSAAEELCDVIRVSEEKLYGERIANAALEKYAEREDFKEDVALHALCHYVYDMIRGELL